MKRQLWVASTALMFALGVQASAHAADPIVVDRQLTDGVDRPIHDIAGEGNASSAEINPALVAAVRGADFTVLGTSSLDGFGRGEGIGAFWAVNVLRVAALGFAVQTVDPSFDDGAWDADALHQQRATKLGGTLAVGDANWGSMGVSINAIRTSQGWLRSPDLDLGILGRAGNWASIGLVAKLAPASLSRTGFRPFLTLDSELAVRPLGTRWLEVAGGIRARMNQTNGTGLAGFRQALGGHGRLGLRWQGLGLHAELEQVPVVQLDENTLELQARGTAMRGGVAIDFAFDHMMGSAGASLGPNRALSSLTFAARLTTERLGRGVWARPVDADRFDLGAVSGERALLAMLTRLRRAQHDGGRSVVVLDARAVSLGWASLEELRAAVIRARGAGAHVFAYLEHADIKDLYIASAAEQVFIHQAGELAPYGLSSTALYFRDALAKLGVRAEAMHIREYKSAHERFSRADRSEYDREQSEALLDAVYDTVIHDVAQARGLTLAETKALFDDSPHSPAAALAAGLVDGVIHRDELVTEIETAIGTPVKFVDFKERKPERETWSDSPYFAVVLVDGTIVDGRSVQFPIFGLNFIGGDSLSKTIRDTRGDPACKGIVLRVNSPGGSALASDIMWREARLTQQAWELNPATNPPIVVSMGDVAASGGYYVAATGAEIFAQKTTITGSIGVVSQHFDISGLLAKLAIGVDTITRGRNPDITSPFKPLTKDQRERLERSMQQIYDLFRTRVSEARGLTMERVDELGRGRVWAGVDAVGLDLVDEIGGLDAAVARLRDLSTARRLPPIALRVVPRRSGLLGLLLDQVEPFGTRIVAARAKAREKKAPLSTALARTIAHLPLSLMLLPQDRAQTVLAEQWRIE